MDTSQVCATISANLEVVKEAIMTIDSAVCKEALFQRCAMVCLRFRWCCEAHFL